MRRSIIRAAGVSVLALAGQAMAADAAVQDQGQIIVTGLHPVRDSRAATKTDTPIIATPSRSR